MGLHEGRGQLADAMKKLKWHWTLTRGQWTDEVAGEFEEAFLVTLESEARDAMAAMDQMAALLNRLRQDCA
jgi:hypothetical protein